MTSDNSERLLESLHKIEDRLEKLERATSVREFQFIRRMTEQIIAAANIDETLLELLKGAIELTGLTLGVIRLFEKGLSGYEITRTFQYPEEFNRSRPRISQGKGITYEVINSKQAIFVPDILLDDRVNEELKSLGIRSLLVIPLIVPDEDVIGALYLYDKSVFAIDNTILDLLKIVASQAALALNKTKLLAEKSSQASTIQLLYAAIRDTRDSQDITDTLHEITRVSLEITGMSLGVIRLVDAIDNQYRISRTYQYPTHFNTTNPRLSTGKGLTFEVIQSRQKIVIPNIDLDNRVNKDLIALGIRSLFLIPLIAHNEVIGVLYLYDKQERKDTDIDSALLDALVEAIKTVLLVDEIKQTVNEGEKLLSYALELTTLLDSEELEQTVVKQVRTLLLDTTSAGYREYDPFHDTLNLVAFDGLKPPINELPANKSISGLILNRSERNYLIVDNYDEWSKKHGDHDLVGKYSGAILIVRLEDERSEAMGTLFVNAKLGRVFTKREAHLLVKYGLQVSKYLKMAKLRINSGRLKTIAEEITKSIVTSQDLDKTLTRIVEEAQRLMQIDVVTLYSLDPVTGLLLNPPKHTTVRHPRKMRSGAVKPDSNLYEILKGEAQYVVPSIRDDEHFRGATFTADEEIESYIATPLKIRHGDSNGVQQNLGVLFAHFRTPRRFDELDLAVYQFLADQAAVAIQSASLLEESKKRAQALDQLNKFAGDIARETDEDGVLKRILEVGISLVGSPDSTGVIHQVEERNSEYRVAKSYSFPSGSVQAASRLEKNIGVTFNVIQTKKPIYITNVQKYPNVNPDVLILGIQALAAFPLIFGDEVLGVLFINFMHVREFPDSIQRILTDFSSYAAIALRNARQIRQTLEFEKNRERFQEDIAHEFKRPVTTIKGFLENIVDGDIPAKYAISEDFKSYTRRYLLEVTNQLNLIEDLLNLNALKITEKRPVDLSILLRTTVEARMPEAQESNLELRVEYPDSTLVTLADERQLTRALENVIANAFRFTTHHGGKITISLLSQGQFAVFIIADTGVGIDADDLPLITNREFQGKNKNEGRTKRGTGLGLHMVKRYIEEAHDGTCRIESERGKGTTVYLSIPLKLE